MYPLIEIKTVPIEIEMKVSHAKLEYTRGTADLEISRNNGGLSIKSRPIKLNIDTFEARNSVVPTAMRSQQQAAQNNTKIIKHRADRRRGKFLIGLQYAGADTGQAHENYLHKHNARQIDSKGFGVAVKARHQPVHQLRRQRHAQHYADCQQHHNPVKNNA